MKCGCHDLAGEAASARSHCDRGEALHPPRVSALQSPLLRPRHGAPGVWTPSCIISAHSRSSSAHALSPLEILSRKLRRMRNTCVRHFPELEQLAAWHCSTVMNMAYRHIHTALRFALSGDEQGLGSRGAEPCFPAPPPAPALRFPALPPPWAALMLPSAGPRGAHTARSDRPCGTTTDGPEPAPTRRSSVASAHPKPGYQRGQARACHFHAGYARPIYLLFRRPRHSAANQCGCIYHAHACTRAACTRACA